LAKNGIKDEGALIIARALRVLTNLRDLELDLGYTGMKDNASLELALSLK